MWLALGTFQLLLLCGCNGSTQSSDNLLSNTSASASDSGSGGAERSDEPAAASTIPVRISRAFFERSLTGSVKIGDEESQSDVSWQ
ncbi:MAG: hypothetical protein HY075_06085 [Deltaproteobacteria bacterium]|nr:hypothetical protein [Deltaproteobacteria bacterium]